MHGATMKTATLYYMVDVLPFLLLQRLLHRDYSNIYNRRKEDGTHSKCCDSHAVLQTQGDSFGLRTWVAHSA